MEFNHPGNTTLLEIEDTLTFEQVFKAHFKGLHAYAYTLLKDEIMAEEMVQNVFCKLWEKSGDIKIKQSVSGYLYRAVYHESINYLRHQKVKATHQAHTRYQMTNEQSSNGNTSGKVILKELQEKLDKALQDLPEKCRTVFQMSRFEELKYQEIADRLDISIKTVENQMGKALRLLRLNLVDYLPFLLILLHL
ncbi:RNA polymerase sigma-70 factor [Chitinophaga nivalis]|uniref:RNA polymerase sigma-70 factor n=1 Tax=Chitinophaga nivalis TaxID=2991709 RepID=A0ABT3IG70_9BACT|nr:RNA polymerase sigma-70 factor [Chitinophaga nivalis]MCW3467355.1 RNA polymerase sigma-70 factor [Chitinophaga nivalis]MCW3482953.1 RNA polymerase sigma-70 factor [Chitinophaga nivalis]